MFIFVVSDLKDSQVGWCFIVSHTLSVVLRRGPAVQSFEYELYVIYIFYTSVEL